MSPFQEAFNRVNSVEDELLTVNSSLDIQRADPSCIGSEKNRVDLTRANTERTYLIRLLTEFEGGLTELAPNLKLPLSFTKDHGLSNKVSSIGKNMGMDKNFRQKVEQDVVDLRNDLAHGSLVPQVAFDDALVTIKTFLRGCY
jgi:hypothetical protein